MYNIGNCSVIYVSPSLGDDREYNGLSPQPDKFGNGPFKTPYRALEAVKQLRVTGNHRPFTVSLTEDCFLDRPLVFSGEISAVTLESFGERKRIIGGKPLTGWKWDTFNGVKCISAVLPKKEDGSRWAFTDFFVNGKRAAETRYPKEGTFRALKTENDVTYPLFSPSKWFIADKKDLEGIAGIEDAAVNYYHFWIDEHSPVESYDAESGKLTMLYESRFAISTTYSEHETSALYYYLTNVPCMFGEKNEWYLDRNTGTVYYVPEDDSIEPEKTVAYYPVISKLIEVESEDIRIRNLEIMCSSGDYVSRMENDSETGSYTESENAAYASDVQSVCWAPGAVNFVNSKRCGIYGCALHGVGVHAVNIETGCKNIRIEQNEIYDICAGGVRIFGAPAGSPAELETGECVIRSNLIHHCGVRYAAGCGVLICHSACNEVSENEIHHLDYTGVSFGWVWGYAENSSFGNIIRGNHIHHIGLGKLSDMGGIYLLGKQPGTIVSENRIHDVTSTAYGGWGIYTDEGSSYITVENNVVYNTKSECYHQHYGSRNVVRNNIFAFGSACVRISREEFHDGILFENNIFLTDGTPVYGEYTSIYTLSSSRNIIWDINGNVPVMLKKPDGKTYTFEDWTRGCGKDTGSITEDPLFADARSYDFTLSENSPALKFGFKALSGFLATGRKN